MWIPILAAGLWPDLDGAVRCTLVLGLFFLSHAFASSGYVAWLSWTSDLVPDEMRGAFFGTRNALCGAAGIVTVLIFGNLVDFFRQPPGHAGLAVGVPFLAAVGLGLTGLYFLNRIGECGAGCDPRNASWRELWLPFKEANFRKYLLFGLLWNFAVHFAAPFFSLYFLRELKFSYGFIALLTAVAAVLDLLGMQLWGRVSDKIKNKSVVFLAGWGVVFLPLLWALVRRGDVLMPLLLQVLSGACWSGINLCTPNMLLRISPQASRVWFLSAYNIMAGLGAALAPILAGFSLSALTAMASASPGRLPLHYIFLISTLLRLASLLVFRCVHEPQETSLIQAIKALGGWRPGRSFTGSGGLPQPLLPAFRRVRARKACK